MTREELISLTIDKYTDLQRIKKSNGGVENKELDYQIKVTLAKLSSLGISVEDITLWIVKNLSGCGAKTMASHSSHLGEGYVKNSNRRG